MSRKVRKEKDGKDSSVVKLAQINETIQTLTRASGCLSDVRRLKTKKFEKFIFRLMVQWQQS